MIALLALTAYAQDPAPVAATMDLQTVGTLVAAVAAALVGGAGAGQWRAARTAPASVEACARAQVNAALIPELRADLARVTTTATAAREQVIGLAAKLDALAEQQRALTVDVRDLIHRIEEAGRAARP